MNTTYPESENLSDIYTNDCLYLDILHTHAQHSEALAEQLLSLESLDARATSIVQILDNKHRGLQAILLAPGIYASEGMPLPEKRLIHE